MKRIFVCCVFFPFAAFACETGQVYTDIECYQKQTQQIKNQMNRSYAELVKLNLYDTHQAFEQSQKLWLQWIEKDCAFENTAMTQSQGAGYGLAIAECKHKHYAARLKQLQSVVKELRLEKE